MDPSSLVALFPAVAPYLAILPIAQVAAGLLAQAPRLFGVQHETVWSRVMRSIASLPVVYRPQPVASVTPGIVAKTTVVPRAVVPSVMCAACGAAILQATLTGTCPRCGATLPGAPRGFAALRMLLFVAALTAIVATGVRCAAVRRGVETVEGAPIRSACFAFDPPVKDSTGTKLCTQLCVSTDPPSAVWACQEVKP